MSSDEDENIPLSQLKKKTSTTKKKKRRLADDDVVPKKKKTKTNGTTSNNKKRKIKPDPAPSSSSTAKSKQKQPKQLKKLEKTERLQFAMQAFLWWDAPSPPEGCQWRTMEHAGVSFPPPYEPHNIKMLYNGEPVDLTPPQEEAWVILTIVDDEE